MSVCNHLVSSTKEVNVWDIRVVLILRKISERHVLLGAANADNTNIPALPHFKSDRTRYYFI